MMKVYIASKYIEHSDINRKIFKLLTNKGFDVFLPESINIAGKTKDEMKKIAFKCYSAIDSCDIILVISPFGLSVSAEIGYAIYKKVKYANTSIILFRYSNVGKKKEDVEAMIVPFYDYIIDNASTEDTNTALNELITILTSIKNK